MRIAFAVVLALLVVLTLAPESQAQARGYLRSPDLHGDQVVFTAEGDLWLAATSGGKARRLTTHAGHESMARFSPDGSQVAFSGDYDGNRDLFVIPAQGGEPRRLTWHPDAEECIDWTPDGKYVVFRSRAEEAHGEWELYRVPVEGGDAERLPLGWAGRIAIDPESGLWAFNRISTETRTWKRYRGGTAMKLWVGHPDRKDFRCLTTFDGSESFPMWSGGRLFCLSDQGGTGNLWSMRADGSERRQLTAFDRWDVRWPAMSPDGRIVFMMAGDLWLLDPQDAKPRPIPIELPTDRVLGRHRSPNAVGALTWYALAPDADRLALVTRGEIFSVPVKPGVTLPVTRGSGARESWATFSPKGDRIVYVSDETREESIATIDAWGRGAPTTVKVSGFDGWHFPPRWSPDGKWIAYADQTQTLFLIAAGGGSPRAVDRSEQSEIREYVWSPDGRWLAYTKSLRTDFSSVFVYDTETGTTTAVTGPTTNDYSPAWDPQGRYLYFLSDRAINPLMDGRDMEYVLLRPTRPYCVLLRRDVDHPLMPRDGLPPRPGDAPKTETPKPDATATADGAKAEAPKPEEPPKPVTIDLDGLAARVVALPVAPGRYGALAATAERVFFLSVPTQGMAEEPDWWGDRSNQAANTLMAYSLEKKKAETFLEGVESFELAARVGKLAVERGNGEFFVVGAEAPPGPDLSEQRVSLDGVIVDLDPREEWAQIYYEAWRHMRDFHWDRSLGGVNWEAARDQYATLLPRLSTRDDLRDLLGELIGELATSHTYVWGGDAGRQSPSSVATGLLGADLGRVGDVFVVKRIYRGDPADNIRSPLAEPGVDVREGEFVLAVNHRRCPPDRPIHALLAGLAGKPVVLTVNRLPAQEGARDVVVVPMAGEGELRYVDWVRQNREAVSRRTNGRMGYVHIPDMGTDGLVRFTTWFYPQLDKEGLVVDVRWNGGGFVSQMILEKLRRHVLSFDRARGGGISTYPYRTLNGPFVVITNEHAGSDGDIFPAAVQLSGAAPVIGKRSWGGVVGIRADKRMVDGGMLTQPEYAWWEPKRGWAIENHGVDPDIEIDNLPQDLAEGRDAQLDKAIRVLQDLHEKHPPVQPDFGPAPVKTRDAFRERELGAAPAQAPFQRDPAEEELDK